LGQPLSNQASFTIAPGVNDAAQFITFNANQDAINAINSKTRNLTLIYEVHYFDIFMVEHRTAFCGIYPGRGDVLVFCDSAGGEMT